MEQSSISKQSIYLPLLLTGAVCGLILSWGLLRGDDMGRINLLHILLLYFVIPVISLFAGIVALVRRQSSQLLSQLLHSSLFNIQDNAQYRFLRQHNLEQLWLMQQIQLFTMIFAISSLVTFFFLLLFTDVSIIWRSTLLQPEDIYPLLSWIALPWQFWPAAQPNLELLQSTQDFRLLDASTDINTLASWWPFVIAVQIVYGIVPRLLLYLSIQFRFTHLRLNETRPVIIPFVTSTTSQNATPIAISTINEPLELFPWDKVPSQILQQIVLNHESLHLLDNSTWQYKAGSIVGLFSQGRPVIVVKSWEAPMGELADELTQFKGYLLPINWQANKLTKPTQLHLQEWQRFATSLNWQVIILDGDYYV